MKNHEVIVSNYGFREGDAFTGLRGEITGEIMVKPPIRPGDPFYDAVFGSDPRGVDLDLVKSTREHTLFIAGVREGEGRDRKFYEDTIGEVAARIKRIADKPSEATQMLGEKPFSK